MYDATAPLLVLALNNVKHIISVGAEHCKEQGIDQEVMLATRLSPDMLPLAKQVQIATDISKGCMARLSGVGAPVFEDNEETFDELMNRCDTTIAFMDSINADQVNGTEEKEIIMKLPSIELKFTGYQYVSKFVMPNVQFHAATAYAILRNNGVALGKRDFLGAIN